MSLRQSGGSKKGAGAEGESSCEGRREERCRATEWALGCGASRPHCPLLLPLCLSLPSIAIPLHTTATPLSPTVNPLPSPHCHPTAPHGHPITPPCHPTAACCPPLSERWSTSVAGCPPPPPTTLLLQLQHSLHCGCIQVSCLGNPPRFGGKSGEMDQQQAAQGCGLAALCISVGPRAGVSISPAHHRRWSLGFRKLCAQLFPHSLNLAEVGLPGSEGDRGTGEGLTPSLGS